MIRKKTRNNPYIYLAAIPVIVVFNDMRNKEPIIHTALIGGSEKAAPLATVLANAGIEVCLVNNNPSAFEEAIAQQPGLLYDLSFAQRVRHSSSIEALRELQWVVLFFDEENTVSIDRSGFLQENATKQGMHISVFLEQFQDLSGIKHLPYSRDFSGIRLLGPAGKPDLVEIIQLPGTTPGSISDLTWVFEEKVGKRVVVCQGSGFAERILYFIHLHAVQSGLNQFLKPEEIDFLTGRLFGWAGKGVFRSIDRMNVQEFLQSARKLFGNSRIPEEKDALTFFNLLYHPASNYYPGNGMIFNPVKGDYRKISKARLKKYKKLVPAALIERLQRLWEGYHAYNQFCREFWYGLFVYISRMAATQGCSVHDVDTVFREGAGWEMGPFEIWNAIGCVDLLKTMTANGSRPAEWVYKMAEEGKTFYSFEQDVKKAYAPDPRNHRLLTGRDIPMRNVVRQEQNATIYDLGENVLNIEIHGYRNIIDAQTAGAIHHALDLAAQKGGSLIISARGKDFTLGVNLGLVFVAAIEKNYSYISYLVREFQNLNMRLKHADTPVMILPKGLTLGGGCEMTLHVSDALCLPETYIGLPEGRAGLLPAGGGTKEMAMRLAAQKAGGEKYLDVLFNLASGKISSSAYEAIHMHILDRQDQVIHNPDRQIATARKKILRIRKYRQNTPFSLPVSPVLPLLEKSIAEKLENGWIAPFEGKIASYIARILAGNSNQGNTIDEQGLLDMEREFFVSLCGERETLKRLKAILNRR